VITLAVADDIWSAAWTAGYQHGYEVGADDYGRCVELWLGITRDGLKLPTQDELAKARAYSDEACSRPNCGRCSRCVRAGAAQRNLCRYGSPDFPGVAGAA